jgi:hypothetical protein
VSLSSAVCALLALAAALFAVPRPGLAPRLVTRILAILAAVAFVPALDEPAAWPAAALLVGAAVFSTPLACLLGAAGAAMAALGFPASSAPLSYSAILAALSLAAGASSMDTETGARLRTGSDPAWPAVVAGLGLCLALALQGESQVLAWRVLLASQEQRVILPGAGLVAGLTLLVALAGALALATHLLTPAVPSEPVRRLGQRLLVLGCGLAVTSLGYVLYRGTQVEEALPAGALGLGAVFLGTGALLCGVFRLLLGRPAPGDVGPWLERAVLEARIAAGLAVGAALAAGGEGWLHGASYATPAAAAAASAALLALATLEPTRLSLLRKALMLAALAFVWRPW